MEPTRILVPMTYQQWLWAKSNPKLSPWIYQTHTIRRCGWGVSPDKPVHKGCCNWSHQPLLPLLTVHPEGIQDGQKQDSGPRQLNCSQANDFREARLLHLPIHFVVVVCSLSSVSKTLCDPKDCSTPGFPVLYHLLGFAQTHVHCVDDTIQPPHPLSPPPALNLSQHQGLFQSVSSSHQVSEVLEFQLQHQSFQ